ncbi:hypothetical protein A9Q81_19185 [Gammaproteobacteria bacterium 42_54_T18]|nr:hypothetical protein A9Q81_19185 [Gammaproteobacteria bacterium 42_54_T18]
MYDSNNQQIFPTIHTGVGVVLLSVVVFLLCLPKSLYALPEGAQVVGGDASVSQLGDVLTIQQNSQQTSINFEGFSIAQHETVNIFQPNSDAIALGRVLGGNPSEIFGNLNANGQFFLINPSGILFGENASVNVGGLVATTLSLSDDDFFAGLYQFQSMDGVGGGVVNNGSIHVEPGGYLALISNTVTSNGELASDNGLVQLTSADQVTIVFSESLPALAVDKATYQGLVSNNGKIQVGEGMVVMSAAVTDALMQTVVNNEGVIEAQGVIHQGGRVFLTSSHSGDVINAGDIDVSSSLDGGEVSLIGDRVAQLGNVNANGGTRGGSVKLFGQSAVALGDGSLTMANGGESVTSRGGEVIAIANGQAIFRDGAVIEATGSERGGFVEVSGYESVDIFGHVSTSATNAPDGNLLSENGTFLIDPFDVTITGATNNNGPAAGVFTPTGTASTIDVATLEANLALGNVVVETTNAGGAEPGDLIVATSINLDGSNGNTLTLQADGSLFVNNSISDQNTVTVDDTNISLVAGGNLQIADGVIVNSGGGTIQLTVGGNATVTGLVTSNNTASAVLVNAASINDAGDSNLDIDANNGGVSLNSGFGNVANMEVAVDTLSMTISGGGAVNITEQDDITLQTFNGVSDLSVTAAGTVTLPDAGLVIANSINIQAADIQDSDSSVVLTTQDATVQLTAAVNDVTLLTSVDRLDVSITGQGGNVASLTVVESNGLQVEDLSGDGNALVASYGNVVLQVQQGDLSVNNTVSATDTLADGVRAGLIDIQIEQGNLLIGDQTATVIQSINTVDDGVDGGLGNLPTNQVAIRIRHSDTGDQSHAFTLGDGVGASGDVTISAQGGDVLIDSYNDASLTLGNTRTITINNDVQINAFDLATDATDGAVVTGSVSNVGSVIARTGRAITLRENETLSVTTPDIVVDVSNDISETIKEESDLSPGSNAEPVGKVSDASRLFASVFNACDKTQSKHVDKERCQLENSMQQFLGTLLIGGDLPGLSNISEIQKGRK